MVINRTEIKRKRKDTCGSFLLDDSPKRTKVHAQRKFAQGSNVSSPVLTPITEIERPERPDALPEPTELLPTKRPNTEDFLTFLCFRGTPILPPNLNFFNTAANVEKPETQETQKEPKNGPIATSAIIQSSGSNERPFIAFGVRKRADPMVISKQMDKKRRHALALQALRRKYQEQRMAKIRAVTISKLSEKIEKKAVVRTTRSLLKTEPIKKKAVSETITKVKVVPSKEAEIRQVPGRSKLKPKMCLRSFRGRFIQQELKFKAIKKRALADKDVIRKSAKVNRDDGEEEVSDFSSDDDKPLVKTVKKVRSPKKIPVSRVPRKSAKLVPEMSFRMTRSSQVFTAKMVARRQQLTRKFLLSKTTTKAKLMPKARLQKPRTRSEDGKIGKPPIALKKIYKRNKEEDVKHPKKDSKKEEGKEIGRKAIKKEEDKESPKKINKKEDDKATLKKTSKKENDKEIPRKTKKEEDKNSPKKANKTEEDKESPKKANTKEENKESPRKANKKEEDKESPKKTNKKDGGKEITKRANEEEKDSLRNAKKKEEGKEISKKMEEYKESQMKANKKEDKETLKKTNKKEEIKETPKSKKEEPKEIVKSKKIEVKEAVKSKKEEVKETPKKALEKVVKAAENKEPKVNKKEIAKKPAEKFVKESKKIDKDKVEEPRISQRPTRKTKEAAAIYMEILGHKLVHDIDVDDDDTSIDSFPELPNVRRTEQREIELKAKANVVVKKVANKTENKVDNKSVKEEKSKAVVVQEKMVTRRSIESIPKEAPSVLKVNPKDIEISESGSKELAKIEDNAKKETISKKSEIQKTKKVLQVAKKIESAKSLSSSSDESDEFITNLLKKKVAPAPEKQKVLEKDKMEEESIFNDSDEEPLSKLTQKKEEAEEEVPLEKIKVLKKKLPGKDNKTSTKKQIPRKLKTEQETSVESPGIKEKLKRECTKIPQNYLTLFSSSDDEEKLFHGFNKPKTTKASTTFPQSGDLLRKDIGKRFGKGKVNMSNEQIEKWLKDSALARTSIKKENDEMLKFGEKIPTETSLDGNLPGCIDTNTLKSSLLVEKSDKSEETKIEHKIETAVVSESKQKDLPVAVNTTAVVPTKSDIISPPKTQMHDRKLIFRKEKCLTPNANAFSASNESSIYAFGEDNEDMISTPFRRPSRRPSSTATSRSEEESSKLEEMSKTPGRFRLPMAKLDLSRVCSRNLSSEEEVGKHENPEVLLSAMTIECPSEAGNKRQMEIEGDNQKAVMKLKLVSKTQKIDDNTQTCMFPPSHTLQKSKSASIVFDDFKYKVPSSPSASSSSSVNVPKKSNSKTKYRLPDCYPINITDFPATGDAPQVVEAPVFHPNDKEFQDPLEYIEKIRQKAERFGICRIIPPSTFKPECKVTDDMRFTAYNQYVHKMLHRWGPNFKEFMAIRKYLKTQNIALTHPPWIGGMEIDLPRLYQTVQSLGGLKEVIEKKKWPKVSELMKIPRSAQDRVTKLDDIYCKYLLPYDTLSPAEREKLFHDVETEWAKRESRTLSKMQQKVCNSNESVESDSDSDNEAEESTMKGRSIALNAFYRIARNTMSMWFKTTEPSPQEVEQEFWKHVTLRQNHICVHSGSIDSGNWGYGFAVSKNSPFARHAWNLKVLTNNSGSVLRSMGPIMGVTVPTLHVGMVFSSCCWYRDPHSLPWIEYLHTGGNKVWYGIPDSMSETFREVLLKLVPNYCRNKTLWLPSDTVMVPPSILVENGVSLCRTVQEPGQFVVVFPKAFTSSVSTGYVVSESVYFAPPYWLKLAQKAFFELYNNCEPSMFSLDRLILSIATDMRSNVEVLKQILPMVQDICKREKEVRNKLRDLGVNVLEKLPLPDAPGIRKRKKLKGDEGDYECEVCRKNLFISSLTELQEDGSYCLEHGLEQISTNKMQSKNCKLLFTYDDTELECLIDKVRVMIENKLQKKIPSKFSGMPTLLK